MSLHAMKEFEFSSDEQSQSHLMIQEFNQGRQKAISLIRFELFVGELFSSALFHIISTKISYNMFLKKLWIHKNGLYHLLYISTLGILMMVSSRKLL